MLNLPLSSDERPSTLVNKMLAAMPPGYKPDFLFNSLFLRRLPSKIRVHLLKKVDEDARELGVEADELWQDKVVSVHNLTSTKQHPPEDVFAVRSSQFSKQSQQRRPPSHSQQR